MQDPRIGRAGAALGLRWHGQHARASLSPAHSQQCAETANASAQSGGSPVQFRHWRAAVTVRMPSCIHRPVRRSASLQRAVAADSTRSGARSPALLFFVSCVLKLLDAWVSPVARPCSPCRHDVGLLRGDNPCSKRVRGHRMRVDAPACRSGQGIPPPFSRWTPRYVDASIQRAACCLGTHYADADSPCASALQSLASLSAARAL